MSIYNYEVQVDAGNDRLSIQGAMSYHEAKSVLTTEALRLKSSIGYIWPQTETARRKICHHFTGIMCDYIIAKRRDSGLWDALPGIIGQS